MRSKGTPKSRFRLEPRNVAEALWSDYRRGGRQDKPSFLKEFLPAGNLRSAMSKARAGVPKRQRRHLV